MACTDQCTCNGTDTDDLAPLERAFYDAFMQDTLDVLPGAKGAAWLKEKATEQARRHAGIVRVYQKAHGITEISELAHKDLLDELASTRREAEAYRFNWTDAEKKIAADRTDRERDNAALAYWRNRSKAQARMIAAMQLIHVFGDKSNEAHELFEAAVQAVNKSTASGAPGRDDD